MSPFQWFTAGFLVLWSIMLIGLAIAVYVRRRSHREYVARLRQEADERAKRLSSWRVLQ